jgi:hypothetical protein
MSVVPDLTLAALNEKGIEPVPHYDSFLRAACDAHPPPYGMAWYGEKYREVAQDASWLANSLIANAAKEGEGSRKLWALAGRTPDGEEAEQIRRHAIDEARHARLYLKMLAIIFPDAVDSDLASELDKLSPGYTTNDQPPKLASASPATVLDEVIQMNIGEIRTRIHQLLLRPVAMAHCSKQERPKLERVLDSLLADETSHIEYTARLIEKASENGSADFVRRTMAARLAEFNEITLQEVGELSFEGA